MRISLLFFVGMSALAACSMDMPSFLGRNPGGDASFRIGGAEPLPEPVALPVTSIIVEPALNGIIIRAEGIAPAQGYYGANLIEFRDGQPDETGYIDLAFVGLPPASVSQVGPPQTREQRSARFFSTAELRRVQGIRIEGAGTTRAVRLN